MAGAGRLSELELSAEEVERLRRAFRDERFQQLFADYAAELADPQQRRLYEQEVTALERERGVAVRFVHPAPGYVLRTSQDGARRCYLNVCSNPHVGPPEPRAEPGGLRWALPYCLAPGREELRRGGRRLLLYDVVFHPGALRMAARSARFRRLLSETALEAVERRFAVRLDRANAAVLRGAAYKGVPQAPVIRSPLPGAPPPPPDDTSPLPPFPYPCPPAPPPPPAEPPPPPARGPTTPRWSLRQRRYVELQDYRCSRDAAPGPVPRELLLRVELPLLRSAAPLRLDVRGRELRLDCERPAYRLRLRLPYAVEEGAGRAAFRADTRQLHVTLPVAPSAHEGDAGAGGTAEPPQGPAGGSEEPPGAANAAKGDAEAGGTAGGNEEPPGAAATDEGDAEAGGTAEQPQGPAGGNEEPPPANAAAKGDAEASGPAGSNEEPPGAAATDEGDAEAGGTVEQPQGPTNGTKEPPGAADDDKGDAEASGTAGGNEEAPGAAATDEGDAEASGTTGGNKEPPLANAAAKGDAEAGGPANGTEEPPEAATIEGVASPPAPMAPVARCPPFACRQDEASVTLLLRVAGVQPRSVRGELGARRYRLRFCSGAAAYALLVRFSRSNALAAAEPRVDVSAHNVTVTLAKAPGSTGPWEKLHFGVDDAAALQERLFVSEDNVDGFLDSVLRPSACQQSAAEGQPLIEVLDVAEDRSRIRLQPQEAAPSEPGDKEQPDKGPEGDPAEQPKGTEPQAQTEPTGTAADAAEERATETSPAASPPAPAAATAAGRGSQPCSEPEPPGSDSAGSEPHPDPWAAGGRREGFPRAPSPALREVSATDGSERRIREHGTRCAVPLHCALLYELD